MKRPFAWIGFSYLLTLLAAVSFGAAAARILCAVIAPAAVVCLCIPRLRRIPEIPAALLAAAVAMGSYGFSAIPLENSLRQMQGQILSVEGVLSQSPYRENGKVYYVLDVQSLSGPQGEIGNIRRIRVSSQDGLEMHLYDTLRGQVLFYQEADGLQGFSSQARDVSRGIDATGTFQEYADYQIEPAQTIPWYGWPAWLRQEMVGSLYGMLPKEEAALLSGVLLGETQSLSDSLAADFSSTGLTHLLSVSGLHLSIVAGSVFSVLRRIRVPHRVSLAMTAGTVLLFMAVTGFPPSVLRSGIMTLLYLGGHWFWRRADSLNSLGFAALTLSFIQPFSAADLGFLLSVFATAGILILSPRIQKVLVGKISGLPWKKRPVLRWLQARFCHWAGGLSTTLGAIGFTLPITLLVFPQVSLVAPLANLLLLLPSTGMLLFGLPAAVLYLLPFGWLAAFPLAFVAGWCTKLVAWGAHVLAQIPFANVPAGFGFVVLWLCCTLILVGVWLFLRRRSFPQLRPGVWTPRFFLPLLSVLLLLVGIGTDVFQHYSPGIFLTVLDTGSPAVLVEKQGRYALLGCGGNGNTLLQYLRSKGISHLDYVQMTEASLEEQENFSLLSAEISVGLAVLEDGVSWQGGYVEKDEVGARAILWNALEVTRDPGGLYLKGVGEDWDTWITKEGEPSPTPVDLVIAETKEGSYGTVTVFTGWEEEVLEALAGKKESDWVYLTHNRGPLTVKLYDGRIQQIRREAWWQN